MPLSLRQTLATLEALGHSPRERLGQNFLVDANIVAKSLQLAAVGPGDAVVEVGPGLGTLTGALLEAGAEVWAVEFDARLAGHLRATITAERFHLLQADAVDSPLAGLPETVERFKVVANLPYAIATPWMEGVIAERLPQRMVLMLQKECADRFCARPGSKKYGGISIFLEAAYDRARGHPVARTCFHPPPGVDSVLLNLIRRDAPFTFHAATRTAIRQLFTQRRKQLGGLMRAHLESGVAEAWQAKLQALGVPLTTRPEAVPLEAWKALDGCLRPAED